ncbi:MAG: sarcosine oxidase [Pseudomonadota bacterium]
MVEETPAPITVTTIEAGVRLSLRTADSEGAGKALGHPLPTKIGTITEAGQRLALALGPDEWMLTAPAGDGWEGLADRSPIKEPHSLVGVGDRELVIVVEGDGAADALSAGCPRDVEAMAVGCGARTVFDGVGIVLLKRAAHRFEIHVWRSYAPHVLHLLAVVQEELEAGL